MRLVNDRFLCHPPPEPVRPRARFDAAAPVFGVPNVQRTIAWYSTCLGFTARTVSVGAGLRITCLERGQAHIFLRPSPGNAYLHEIGDSAWGWNAFIPVAGLWSYFKTISCRATVLRPPSAGLFGETSFEIRDCNGFVLVFAEYLDPAGDSGP